MNKFMRALQKASREGARAGYNLIMEDLAASRIAPRSDEPQNVAQIEWNGEGLPPAGTTCEISSPWRDQGCKVRVLCHDEGGAICRLIDGEDAGYLRQYAASDLQPIPEWNGQGFPAVGTVCVKNLEHEWEWETVTVIAHDLGSVIIRRLEDEGFYVYDPVDASQLRPPRTPEQIADDNLKRLNAESETLRKSAWSSPRLLVSSSDRSIDEDLNKQ